MLRLAQEQLAEVVEDTGFEGRVLGRGAASDAAQLRVDGMTCGACSAAVEKALRAAPGVLSASVNLMAGTAQVRSALLGWAGLPRWHGVSHAGAAPSAFSLPCLKEAEA